MKKLFLILSIALVSCDASIRDSVVVEQINITNKNSYKYKVKLKSENSDVFYYTNIRYQVGDTLDTYRTFFSDNGSNSTRMSRENDSLRRELTVVKYYLEILKERVVGDTIRRNGK